MKLCISFPRPTAKRLDANAEERPVASPDAEVPGAVELAVRQS